MSLIEDGAPPINVKIECIIGMLSRRAYINNNGIFTPIHKDLR